MKNISVKIIDVKSIDELEDSWNNDDLKELLRRFDFPDAGNVKQNELMEFLFMAITDFEPSEAAAILLDYKLSDVLNEGQIDNMSHEMLREKVSENYSDIYIHKILFSINQLLYKAYNGKFPHTKATVVELEIKSEQDNETEITKEIALQALRAGFSESNLIIRLLSEQLDGNAAFPEAEGILWELKNKGDSHYQLITSEKWIKKDDFIKLEYECTVNPFVDETEEE